MALTDGCLIECYFLVFRSKFGINQADNAAVGGLDLSHSTA